MIMAYKTDKSIEYHRQAMNVVPSGLQNNFLHTDGIPVLYFTRGNGSRIWDVDGNEYLDFDGKHGSQFLGHGNEKYLASLQDQMGQVLSVDWVSISNKACYYLQRFIPCCDFVRFSLSGTEAISNAARLAKAYTEKPIIIKFHGHYHGSSDLMLHGEQVKTIAWNSLKELEDCVNSEGNQVAAIIMEPVCMSSGGIMVDHSYLHVLRQFCHQKNILLIFDEVITGIRTHIGGMQVALGITPDIAVFSKSLGNGIPISAICAKQEIMQLYIDKKVIHGGTYNGYPLGLAAVCATFDILTSDEANEYKHLHERAEKMKNLLIFHAKHCDLPLSIQGADNSYTINCSTQPVKEYSQWTKTLIKKNTILRACMQDHGILLAPVSRIYPNIAFTDNDLDFINNKVPLAFRQAVRIINKLGVNS